MEMGKVDVFGEFKSEFDPHPDTEKSKGKEKMFGPHSDKQINLLVQGSLH